VSACGGGLHWSFRQTGERARQANHAQPSAKRFDHLASGQFQIHGRTISFTGYGRTISSLVDNSA
jgi:hypothetical protein